MLMRSITFLFAKIFTSICAVSCIYSSVQASPNSVCESQFSNYLTVRRMPQDPSSDLGMKVRKITNSSNLTKTPRSYSSDTLLYIFSGTAVLKFSGEEYNLSPGSVVFIPAGNSFQYELTNDELVAFETYNTGRENIQQTQGLWLSSERYPYVNHLDKLPDWSEWAEGNPVLTKFVFDGKQDYPFASMVFGFAKIPPGAELMEHKHPEDHYEGYYIIDGTATSYINKKPHILNGGEGLFIEGAAYHHTMNKGDKDLIFLFVFSNEEQFTNVEYIID